MPTITPDSSYFTSQDVLAQLRDYQWRGISFPVAEHSITIEQDHAEHRWPDKDGAHIEATGRAPLVFSARALFRLNIIPAKGEAWGGQALYPGVFRQFLTAVADRTSGDMQHPELGLIKCKVRQATVHYDPNKRDGADVEVTWIETLDSPGELAAILTSPSPASAALVYAGDLDTQLGQLNIPNPSPGESLTFTQALFAIQGAFDQASLLNKQIGGAIDHLIYRLNNLQNAITALKSPTAWPATQSLQHLLSAAYDLRKQLLVANRDISIWITPTEMTLGTVSARLGKRIDDLIKLNPSLASAPKIAARSVIRYYAA